jgi:predicted secreted hydrolase
MKRWISGILIAIVALLFWQRHFNTPPPQHNNNLDLNQMLGNQTDMGFAKADQPRSFSFPEDHAAHPDYRIEWWYLTGNLKSESTTLETGGNEFGYQITFFRTALQSNPPHRQSRWASNQLWMAHLAVSDINQKKHYQQQRLSRGTLGLAGIQQQPFKIWLDDWQITANDNGNFPLHITAKDQQFSINLTVNSLKPVVLQGKQGLSQKSLEPGNASYYYSFTRLHTTGTLTVEDKEYQLNGLSWLDREWSSSALGKHQSGWDWFSLQLNNGEELMYYRMRNKKNNRSNPTNTQGSQGKWINKDGTTINLTSKDVTLTPLEYWQAENGKRYPVSWKMAIPRLSQHLIIKAAINDQLMRTSVEYWEGSVTVHSINSKQQIGQGYLEMTGY